MKQISAIICLLLCFGLSFAKEEQQQIPASRLKEAILQNMDLERELLRFLNRSSDQEVRDSLSMALTELQMMKDTIANLKEDVGRYRLQSDSIGILHADLAEHEERIASIQQRISDIQSERTQLEIENQNLSREAEGFIDTLRMIYARKLPHFIATEWELQLGIRSINSIHNPSRKERHQQQLLPVLNRLNSLNNQTKTILTNLNEDRRKSSPSRFETWKPEAIAQLQQLRTEVVRAGTQRYQCVALLRIIDAAKSRVENAAYNKPADFADLLAEWPE